MIKTLAQPQCIGSSFQIAVACNDSAYLKGICDFKARRRDLEESCDGSSLKLAFTFKLGDDTCAMKRP